MAWDSRQKGAMSPLMSPIMSPMSPLSTNFADMDSMINFDLNTPRTQPAPVNGFNLSKSRHQHGRFADHPLPPMPVMSPAMRPSISRSSPGMAVKVHIQFADPMPYYYSRSYPSSKHFQPDEKLCKALGRRIDHCMRELITRRDLGALESRRKYDGAQKPLRFETTFQICLKATGVWSTQTYRSYQKVPLDRDSARDIILAVHRIIGLFMRRHDDEFVWIDGPIKEDFSSCPETTHPIHGAPLPLTCIPRSRFDETTQSFETIPGFTMHLDFSSRCRRRQPGPWLKTLRVNSRQGTPLTLPIAEEFLWKVHRALNDAFDDRKREFDRQHATCDGLEGYGQCQHFEEDAFLIEVSVKNNLGPDYNHLNRKVRTDIIIFPDPEFRDVDQFIDSLKPSLVEARDAADAAISALSDFDFKVLEVRGRGWLIARPISLKISSESSYSRSSVEAILDRIQTAIDYVIDGNDIICRMTAHKRGHLILDKTVLAQRERGIRGNHQVTNIEKKAFVAKMENQIRQEVAMVCQQTTSTSEDLPLPEFEIYSAPQILGGEEPANHEASVEKFYPIRPEDALESLYEGQDTAPAVSEYESLSEFPQDFSTDATNIPEDDKQFKVVVDSNGEPVWVEVENESVSNVATEEVPEVEVEEVEPVRETPIATRSEDVDANLETFRTISQQSPKAEAFEEVPAQVMKITTDLTFVNDLATKTPSLAHTERLDATYAPIIPDPDFVAPLLKTATAGETVNTHDIAADVIEESLSGIGNSSVNKISPLHNLEIHEAVSNDAVDNKYSPVVILEQLLVKIPSDALSEEKTAPLKSLVDKDHEGPFAFESVPPAEPVLPTAEGINSELEDPQEDMVKPAALQLVSSRSSENFSHQPVKHTNSEASIASKFSMNVPHSDSVSSTPSLSKSSPHGTSPNNSILFTPQYFTTGATYRLFEVHTDGLGYEHSLMEPAESPILSTKRHSAFLSLESHRPLRTDLRSGDAYFTLPSPTESSASGIPEHEVQSSSYSQPTIRRALDINVKPSKEELRPPRTSEAREGPSPPVETEPAQIRDAMVFDLCPERISLPLDDDDAFDLPRCDTEDNPIPKQRSQSALVSKDNSEHVPLPPEADSSDIASDDKYLLQIPEIDEVVPTQIPLTSGSEFIYENDDMEESQPMAQSEITPADKCTSTTRVSDLQDVVVPADDILSAEARDIGISSGSAVGPLYEDAYAIDTSSAPLDVVSIPVDNKKEELLPTARPHVQPASGAEPTSLEQVPNPCNGGNQVQPDHDLEATVLSRASTDSFPLLAKNDLAGISSQVKPSGHLSPNSVPLPSFTDDDDLLNSSDTVKFGASSEDPSFEQRPNLVAEDEYGLPSSSDGGPEVSTCALEHVDSTTTKSLNENLVSDLTLGSTSDILVDPQDAIPTNSQHEHQVPESSPKLSEPECGVFEDDGSVLEQLSEMSRNSSVGYYDLSEGGEQSGLPVASIPAIDPAEVDNEVALLGNSPSIFVDLGAQAGSSMPLEHPQTQVGSEDMIAPGPVLNDHALLAIPPSRPVCDNDQTPARNGLTIGIPSSPETVMNSDELTPRGPPQIDYLALDPCVPERFGDASPTEGPSDLALTPLRREASSIYSYSTSHSSTISSMEPKTSYELLDIKDMPTRPESHVLPSSAGYLGLHEERRVEVGLRGAIMGPFRSRATQSRPSSSGNVLAGHGREKSEKRHWWDRKRNKSMDITTVTKMSAQSKEEGGAALHLPVSTMDVEGKGKCVEISAVQPEATAPPRQEADELPRASFASSRKSVVSVTAHHTTEVKDDRPVSRLMIVFAGVTIAGSFFAKSGRS